MKFHSIISSTIGLTPLVRLNRMVEDIDVEIFAKLEFFNPLGSVKDRIAASMIEAAELE
jgi:cysteine synthase A